MIIFVFTVLLILSSISECQALTFSDIKLPPGVQAAAAKSLKWRWAYAEVPYTLSGEFTPKQRGILLDGFDIIEKYSCVRFVKRTKKHEDYLYLYPGLGCHSHIGRIGGRQETSLDPRECLKKGIILHELMHILGFLHEHSRPDRDEYVQIRYGNIVDGKENQFRVYPEDRVDDLGLRYDYKSIMHYPQDAYSSNGRDTIVPVRPVRRLGQRRKLSKLDKEKLNLYYKCEDKEDTSDASGKKAKRCQDRRRDCKKYKSRFCTRRSLKKTCAKTCGLCK